MQTQDNTQTIRHDLLDCFQQAIQAVHGRECVMAWHRTQAPPLTGPFAMVAIGKASQAMAQGALDCFGGQIDRALVIYKAGQMQDIQSTEVAIETLASSHPVPDERSLQAGQRLIDFVVSLPANMPILFLISGGTSALVDVLQEGINMADLQHINSAMLAGGMRIEEMNRVRKVISKIKAGGLLEYIGKRRVINLLLSDVPGDDPAVIGSGLLIRPTELIGLPDSLPLAIKPLLSKLSRPDYISVNDVSVETCVVASNQMACEVAANHASRLGYSVYVHEELLTQDVNEVANNLMAYLDKAEAGIHIWGAEPTVKLPNEPGRGGRNQQLALMLASRIQQRDDLYILVAASDGDDGVTEDAGGLVDSGTIMRGNQEGLNVQQCLARADAGTFLEASGDLVCTGPTGTNVMDLIIVCKS